jgi:hypothetical protein
VRVSFFSFFPFCARHTANATDESGDTDAALRHALRALQIKEETLGPNHLSTAGSDALEPHTIICFSVFFVVILFLVPQKTNKSAICFFLAFHLGTFGL